MAAKKPVQQRKPTCRTPGCKNISQARELCAPCLREVYELINAGTYTEAELIAKGVVAPMKKPGRKKAGRVTKALLARSKR